MSISSWWLILIGPVVGAAHRLLQDVQVVEPSCLPQAVMQTTLVTVLQI